MTDDDFIKRARIVYNLRFDKEAVANSLTKTIPSFEEHCKWFKEHEQEYKFYQDLAYFRKDGEGFVSVAVDKYHRNQGIATEMLRWEHGKAIILQGNHASLCCFVKAGFRIKGFYLEKEEGLKRFEE